jgi:hypothetical protein
MTVDHIETFLGFYPADGFWVGKRIDLWNPECGSSLEGIVPKIVVWSETERFKVAVCVDGLMLLRMKHLEAVVPDVGDPRLFNESVAWLNELFDYANALQLCIESESIKCGNSSDVSAVAVINAETCRVGFSDGKPVNRTYENKRSLMSARSEAIMWVLREKDGPAPLEAILPGWSPWQVVSKEAIELAICRFAQVVVDTDLVKWLSFMAKAKTAYAKNDYAVAFMLLWFVIESATKTIWSAQSGRRDSERSMFEIAKELQTQGVIDADTAERISKVRQVRNKLMHEPGKVICLPQDCVDAAVIAIRLATRNSTGNFSFKWESSASF